MQIERFRVRDHAAGAALRVGAASRDVKAKQPSTEVPTYGAPTYDAPTYDAPTHELIRTRLVDNPRPGSRLYSPPPTLAEQMLGNHGKYDQTIARALCSVASWCYAEPDTFARMMTGLYLPDTECVTVSFENDALLVNNDVFLLQSTDGKVAVLSFRGTSPLSAITWAANASVSTDPFRQVGYVHGGFYRSVLALFSVMRPLLTQIVSGKSIVEVADALRDEFDVTNGAPAGAPRRARPGRSPSARRRSSARGEKPAASDTRRRSSR